MPQAPSHRRFLVAVMLFVIVVINYLDRSNISIVGPQLVRALQRHVDQLHLVAGHAANGGSLEGAMFKARGLPRGYLPCAAQAWIASKIPV